MNNKNGGKFVLGALIGAAAGAIAGVLLAPKSGKETRKELGKKAKDYSEKAKECAEKGKDFVVAEAKQVGEAVTKITDQIKKN